MIQKVLDQLAALPDHAPELNGKHIVRVGVGCVDYDIVFFFAGGEYLGLTGWEDRCYGDTGVSTHEGRWLDEGGNVIFEMPEGECG